MNVNESVGVSVGRDVRRARALSARERRQREVMALVDEALRQRSASASSSASFSASATHTVETTVPALVRDLRALKPRAKLHPEQVRRVVQRFEADGRATRLDEPEELPIGRPRWRYRIRVA